MIASSKVKGKYLINVDLWAELIHIFVLTNKQIITTNMKGVACNNELSIVWNYNSLVVTMLVSFPVWSFSEFIQMDYWH